ncbi:motile sperm domain-containing protein 2-like [Pectinophora gossypiella]|uniref:MSP domain-containing protein n=1 Tax=Pectinophora gossypiella TaxID=13191 RepID=A0A1E1W359_PECGO|nr:motile sperm domain-containing protein 2-like [Pectinophora gossypiella]
MATASEVRALFEARLKDGIPNPPGEFNPSDLERVKDDKYINRIIAHMENNVQLAADMLWDIMVWRKTVGANELNESNIRMDYVQEGTFFPHGRDIDGSLLMVIKSKHHVKGQKDMEEIKKIVIYWFDRIEREEGGKKISLFFDMDGCGLGNMDMELIKYLITLLKLYYPFFLNYIIIYQMPWVLSAAFKVVKTLLPAKAVEKMKFVTKDTLKDIVAPDQALVCWGGRNEYVFKFVPENRSEQTPAKKVTFAEQGDNQHSLGEMLRLVPNDVIVFKTDSDEVSGQFTITNMDESAISFKIRTTSPEKFRVRPSSGILGPGLSQTVTIVVQAGFQTRSSTKDRFLVMSVQIPKTDLTQKELAEVWQNSSSSKVDEYRLKCQFPENNLTRNGNLVEGKSNIGSDSVTNALNNLQMHYELLNKQVTQLKIFQFLTLLLTAFTVLLGYMIYKGLDEEKYCDRI